MLLAGYAKLCQVISGDLVLFVLYQCVTMYIFSAGIYGPGRSAIDSAMNKVSVLILLGCPDVLQGTV